MLFAATINGFTQHVIQLPYDGSPITEKITFKPLCGEGDVFDIQIEFAWDQSNSNFSMTFKNEPALDGKFMYLFGGNYKMGSVKNTESFKNIWFDKKLIGDCKRELGSSNSKNVKWNNISQINTFFDMSQGYKMTSDNEFFDGEFYAYTATTKRLNSQRDRQIISLSKVSLKISPIKPCDENIVRNKLSLLENLSNEIPQITTKTSNLKEITCEEYKSESASLKLKDTVIDSDCPACSHCPDFVALKDQLSDKIKEYLSAVKSYNTVLTELQKKYSGTCSQCACNCNKFKEVRENIGSLLWDLQTGRTTKAKANEEFKKIQSSLPCFGKNCKDCESYCKSCATYKAYKKDFDELKKLLK